MSTLTEGDAVRFWDKVERGDEDQCWRWLGGFFSTGYPYFWLRGSGVGGHRVMCAMHHGLAAGRYALHSCDNPGCVNPKHLRWGTPADNMDDRSTRGRAPRGEGHPQARLTDEECADLRQLHSEGVGTPELGRRFNVSTTTAWLIATGQRRTAA
jgi:hypothetical protein